MKLPTIHFIMTGGTIDSLFDPTKDTNVIGENTVIPDYIKKLKLHNPCEFTVAFLKDSREVRHQDRKELLKLIKKSPHAMIIITHGTYTMPDTAQYLQDELTEVKKTVILTGSMIPLKGFDMSDAGFNLGYAVGQVQNLKAGIYLCMNATVFKPDEVDKNRMQGRFERV